MQHEQNGGQAMNALASLIMAWEWLFPAPLPSSSCSFPRDEQGEQSEDCKGKVDGVHVGASSRSDAQRAARLIPIRRLKRRSVHSRSPQTWAKAMNALDPSTDGIGTALRLEMASRPDGHSLKGVVRIARKAAARARGPDVIGLSAHGSLAGKPFPPALFGPTMTAPLVDAVPVCVDQACDHDGDGDKPKRHPEYRSEFHQTAVPHIRSALSMLVAVVPWSTP